MSQSQAAALLRLFDETGELFHRLRTVASELHGDLGFSAGLRGVLRSLDSLGPQTVPQLARARPVSRQRIQVLVSQLVRDGWVATEENPAHRKSPLLRLTAAGKRQLEYMHKRERKLLAHTRVGLEPKELNRAADTLRALRRFLESKDWHRQVAGKT
jgi:DNA-binding MarR family transcriptional regulator